MRLFILATFLASVTLGTEIDSFTLRDPFLKDGLAFLNQMMSDYFAQAIEKANSAKTCDPKKFEDILHGLTTGLFWSDLEVQIENSKSIDKRTIDKSKSIYQDITFLDGPALMMAKLGFLLRIGDLYVGSDKFGHFIDQGYYYYQSDTLEEGFAYGEKSELTYYGLATTGVYSYGDLTANYDGYNFWNHVTKGKDPYVTCSNNRWTQRMKFTWSDYVSPAWDEGLNCSAYRNEQVTRSVYSRIEALGMTCPVRKGYCGIMLERYGYLAPRLITQACFY